VPQAWIGSCIPRGLLVEEGRVSEERPSDAVPRLPAPCRPSSPTDDVYAPCLPNRSILLLRTRSAPRPPRSCSIPKTSRQGTRTGLGETSHKAGPETGEGTRRSPTGDCLEAGDTTRGDVTQRNALTVTLPSWPRCRPATRRRSCLGWPPRPAWRACEGGAGRSTLGSCPSSGFVCCFKS